MSASPCSLVVITGVEPFDVNTALIEVYRSRGLTASLVQLRLLFNAAALNYRFAS